MSVTFIELAVEEACGVLMGQTWCNAFKLEVMRGEETRDLQHMSTIATRPPVFTITEPFVPVCTDSLGLLGDGGGWRVEERIRLGLSLENLQCKALASMEGCESSCEYIFQQSECCSIISYRCGNASARCRGCLT